MTVEGRPPETEELALFLARLAQTAAALDRALREAARLRRARTSDERPAA